jgi:hypothetical protein
LYRHIFAPSSHQKNTVLRAMPYFNYRSGTFFLIANVAMANATIGHFNIQAGNSLNFATG